MTPYNDSVLSNTFLAGTSFPMAPFGVLLFLAVVANWALHGRGWRFVLLGGVLHGAGLLWWTGARPEPLLPSVVLGLGNAALLWAWRGARPFSAAELMTIWAIMMVASGIPSSGLLRMIVPQAAGYQYGKTPENLWEERLGPHLRPYMYVADESAATEFFTGAPDTPPIPGIPERLSIAHWTAVPWGAWRDVAWGYGVLTFGVFLGSICLMSILRKQWAERERYPYPLVDLPLEISLESEKHRGSLPLFRNPLFLATATVIIILHSYAGLCRLSPSFGRFRFALDLQNIFTEAPWRYMNNSLKYLRIYPIGIGVSYAVSTEVLFSVWSMKVLIGIQEMYFGMRGNYGGEVAFGWDPAYQCYPKLAAYLALAGWLTWTARRHLGQVLRAALARPGPTDADEAMSYRAAVWGFILSVAVLAAWFVVSGVRLWVALVVILVYHAIAIGCAWLVCQGGQMLVAARTTPSDTIVGLFGNNLPQHWGGASVVTRKEIAVLPIFESPFSKDLREIFMPNVGNLIKSADAGVTRRGMLWAGVAAVVLAIVVAAPRKVALGYEHAAATLPDGWGFITAATLPYDFPAKHMVRDFPTNLTNLWYFAAGAAFVLGCLIMRSNFLWWRLHPGGLCIAASFAGDVFWFTVFLAWAIKSVILYFGGRKSLQVARPFFYGLIVGDAVSWVIWMIVGLAVADPTRIYSIMPL